MLMPSQSPPPTTTIQTLPSDQQQQQQRQQQQQKRQQDEYVDTLHSQKDNRIKKLRRKKSMEFDDDVRFVNHINDDINNNDSNFETNEEMNKSETSESSSPSSADDDAPLSVAMPSSTPISSNEKAWSTDTNSILNKPFSAFSSSTDSRSSPLPTRRPIRPATMTRRLAGGDSESISTIMTVNEPDPNVFLISSDTNSHNTIRKTKHDVKRFVTYIDEQFSEQASLHTLPAEKLCRYLKHYFENTKKFDGTEYEPDTLRSFLLSIERYLKSKQYGYNLMESPLFQPCRQVIMNKREQWRKMGGGNHANHHHSTKTTLPILNLKNITVFDRTKPDGLLLEVYSHVTKLCQNKTLSINQLLWSDIALIDEQYLVCQQTKSDPQTIKLHATPNQLSTCPVQAYRLYATHRPPQCNTPQSPFFLMPRATAAHHIWYKTTAAGKNLEQVLQHAIQRCSHPKQSSSPSSTNNFKILEHPPTLLAPHLESHSSSLSSLNGKRSEARLSSPHALPMSKRIHSSPSLAQPLNLSAHATNLSVEDDSGTASSSPTHSISNELYSSSGSNRTPSLLNDLFHKPSTSVSANAPVWDESVTEILLTVAKQRDTRMIKINTLRTYLEEQLGVVEFLCLYRGFKSEPKLTFHGTPWEHYQRFLPVLFTLLALENTLTSN